MKIHGRRLRLVGHVLRMPQERTPKVALRWTPPGNRKRGRPKTTWRRTVQKELNELGLSMGQAETAAKDRMRWKGLVSALCPARDEEDYDGVCACILSVN